MKKIIRLCAIALIVTPNFAVMADTTDTSSSTTDDTTLISPADTPQVTQTITFSDEQAAEYKQAMQETLQEDADSLRQQASEASTQAEKDELNKEADTSENFNVNSLFDTSEDGTPEINLPLRNGTVDIDGTNYPTDNDGNIIDNSTTDIVDDNSDISATDDNDVEVATNSTPVNVDTDTDQVQLTTSFNKFTQGIDNMSSAMHMQLDKSKPGKESVKWNGKWIILYNYKRPIGYYYGAKAGRSPVVVNNTSIVKCNKETSGEQAISEEQFGVGDSDCAISIRHGLLYNGAPKLFPNYKYSRYCVEEAFKKKGTEDIFCNGKTKMTNGGSKHGWMSCSSFPGINMPESFHYLDMTKNKK